MHKSNNNYAFVDSQNLNLGIREQGWVLDFKRFRIYLLENYSVTKAFLFIGYVPENQWLYTALQKEEFILIFKPTLNLPGGKVKGNVDAELVLHTMIEYPNYDQALIVTGDGDFACLIEYLLKKQKLLRLMVPDRNRYSSLLARLRPKIVFMNDLRRKLEYKKEAFPRDETLWIASNRDSKERIAYLG
ncbi:MAG: NYN domain-containing protein [Candidatus Omnitrophica bacterium]|nr:NYN domain-containing protein [Candidatus Omnitrophota bacterium]